MQIHTKSPEETQELAQKLLTQYPNHKIWLLYGNLAAGKTTFVKGLAAHFDLNAAQIKSPTFTYVNEYDKLIHYDLYRLETMDVSLAELLQEHLDSGKQVLIEWPEVAEELITQDHLKIRFTHQGDDVRAIEVAPHPSQ